MSTMRLSGLISGMDTESIIQELVSAKQTKVDNTKKAQTKHEYRSTTKRYLYPDEECEESHRTGRATCGISAYRPADEPQLISGRNEAYTFPHR